MSRMSVKQGLAEWGCTGAENGHPEWHDHITGTTSRGGLGFQCQVSNWCQTEN